MTTQYQDDLDDLDDLDMDELSIEQLMHIALHSDSKAVQKALKKLEFVIRLSHSEEEINNLSRQIPSYNVRIGIPSNTSYDYLRFEIHANALDVQWNNYYLTGRLRKSKENIFYMGSLK